MKLDLIITEKGLSALVDARAGSTNAVSIAGIGLTSTPFIAAPTLTVLPGEYKRLTTVSGNAVSETVIHTVATDDSADSYTVTGVGLFLNSGELFGCFSVPDGADAIFEKAATTTFLFAADITFESGDAALIEFGDTNFLNPPATETTKGVAYLATAEEVAAGTDAEKIVTPATLAGHFIPTVQKGAASGVAPLGPDSKIPPSFLPPVDSIDTFYATSDAQMVALAAAGPGDFCQRTDLNKTFRLQASPPSTLSNWVEFLSPGAPVRSVNGKIGDVVVTPTDVGSPPNARAITGSGLAKGGGNLSADRAIDVAIADAAETLAGIINDKAVTPASLALVLAGLAAAVPSLRRLDTAGLAQGGGDMSANRTITVPKATGADVEGLVDDTKAITAAALAGTLRQMGAVGYLRIPGTPLILQWGAGVFIAQRGGTGRQNYSFPTTFPNTCFQVFWTPTSNTDDGDEADEPFYIGSRTNTGFSLNLDAADSGTVSFCYLALGI